VGIAHEVGESNLCQMTLGRTCFPISNLSVLCVKFSSKQICEDDDDDDDVWVLVTIF